MTSLLFAATSLTVALIAVLAERLAGYPSIIYARIGHPVEWIGALISTLDRRLNGGPDAGAKRLRGVVAVAVLLVAALAVTVPLTWVLRGIPFGYVVEALLATTLLSQRDLRRFVRAVADGLDHSLEAGRAAVRHIVGRDPHALDETGVAKGAIESLAENTSDGVIAPVLWLIVFGLPGIALYKAVNTADSMIGYRSEVYRDFGWAAARLDDMLNLPAARISGFLFALAARFDGRKAYEDALAAMRRDAPDHVSPNAGWPEAAMAGALGIALGGPRTYENLAVELPWMGDGRQELTARDIRSALALYARALNLLLAVLAVLVGVIWLIG